MPYKLDRKKAVQRCQGALNTDTRDKYGPFRNRFLGRPVLGQSDVQELASRLATRLSDFEPKQVLYLKRGGERVGKEIARILGLPSQGLDICYPVSRIERTWLSALIWPLKELIYRMAAPTIKNSLNSISIPITERLALVDDSAGTGRTLRIALDALRGLGVDESLIRVAVIRCGKRARSLVDHFEIGEPVLFRGR